MRKAAMAASLVAALAMAMPRLTAQEKEQPRSEDTATEARSVQATPLKIAVTFTEFEGDKKVKSLPYSMVVGADGKPPKSVLKVGSRVPVYVGKEYGMQYLDIGTSIDCQASPANDNRFDIKLILERSWVEGNVPVAVDPAAASQSTRQFQNRLCSNLNQS